MTLRFQLVVGEGMVLMLRRLAARCWAVGEPGAFLGLPASGKALSRDARASSPCATARGQDTDGPPRALALRSMPSICDVRPSLLELFGILGPPYPS